MTKGSKLPMKCNLDYFIIDFVKITAVLTLY